MTEQELRNAIQAVLIENGWRFDRLTPAATFEVQTAVGCKSATVSLDIRSTEESAGRLFWAYYSEGRNVLSTSTVFIRKDVDRPELRKQLLSALDEVHRRIDASYARGLYLKSLEGTCCSSH